MNTLSIFVSNYPGTNVNSVGRVPIARIYSVMLPLMLAANDMLTANDMLASNDMLEVVRYSVR